MYFKSTSSRPQISPFAFLTTISPCCLSFLLLFLFVYNEEYYFALWWNHCKLFDLFLNKQLCTCSKSLIRVVVLYRSVIILRIPPPLWRWRDMWMPPRLLICGIYLPTYLPPCKLLKMDVDAVHFMQWHNLQSVSLGHESYQSIMISRAEIMHWESMQTSGLVTDGIETNLGKSFLTRIDIYVWRYNIFICIK